MAHSIDFRVVAHDFASRDFRQVGNAALLMAAKVKAANAEMDAAMMRSFHRTNGWAKGLMALLPVLPPLFNAVAVSAGGLVSVLMSVGPGLGALFFALSTNFKAFKDAHGVKNLTDFGVFQKFSAATKGMSFQIFGDGLKMMGTLLPRLIPVVKAFGDVFDAAIRKTTAAMQGPGFAKFLAWVAKVGAANFSNLISSMMNLGIAFANIGRAFSGTGLGITAWLDHITGKFASWTATMSKSSGFQAFMRYFQQNGPLIGQVVEKLAIAFAHIAEAVAPLGHFALRGVDNLLTLFNKIPPSTLFKMAAAFSAIKVAIWGISAAQAAWNIAADANPIGAIILALVGLGAALVVAWKKSGQFRTFVKRVWADVQQAWSVFYTNFKPEIDWLVNNGFKALGKAADFAFKILDREFRGANLELTQYERVAKPVLNWLAHTGFPALRVAARAAFSVINAEVRPAAGALRGFMAVVVFMSTTVLRAFAAITRMWGTVLRALSHIPGFGWAKGAADAMFAAAGAASALASRIAALRSKSITVTTNFVTNHTIHTIRSNSSAGTRQGQQINTHYATGGRPPVGRASWVGENGPELWVPDQPGKIIPNHEISRNAGSGSSEPIKLDITVRGEDGRVIQRKLLKVKREGGGAALGLA